MQFSEGDGVLTLRHFSKNFYQSEQKEKIPFVKTVIKQYANDLLCQCL